MKKFKNNIVLLAISLSVFASCGVAEGSPNFIKWIQTSIGRCMKANNSIAQVQPVQSPSSNIASTVQILDMEFMGEPADNSTVQTQIPAQMLPSHTLITVQSTPQIWVHHHQHTSISIISMIRMHYKKYVPGKQRMTLLCDYSNTTLKLHSIYCGIKMQKPLTINVHMTPSQICQALAISFGCTVTLSF